MKRGPHEQVFWRSAWGRGEGAQRKRSKPDWEKTSRMLEGGVKGPVGIAQGLEQVLSNEGSNDSRGPVRRIEKDHGNYQGAVGNLMKKSCIVGSGAHLRRWNKQRNGPQ